ncbi:GDSL-type esterase/lipase family protein [Hymenobacter cellulosilyticus]|uniref:GDSL-type esterase/lipase family protein n=1 Tax=Hymenobacter cellulosilyticus TaxID=2932248 RepID=A0A8T9Q749_9BACT|nr:GDSL-type esterase/lipase family protein [Hymenobacter cellulosilyticus]UOQ72241.1 GDSL-type esterase/lipase family protein [Hymenobacter cellulosilyticus]
MRLLLILFLFLGFGCTQDGVERAVPSTGSGGTASNGSFLSLGDSYTIGEGVSAADRWSVQLARSAGLATPDIIARTGWTTGELQQAIAAAQITKTYDLVSLMIGVNNQFRGLPLSSYRTEFRALLRTAIGFAANRPGRVVVLSTPTGATRPLGRATTRTA